MVRTEDAFFDSVIVGAGTAGLACGIELLKRKKSFAIFEARPRIGGRILTRQSKVSQLPVELGPEFIHGYPSEIMSLTDSSKLPFYDVTDLHYTFQKKKPVHLVKEYWDILQNILEKIPRNPEKDQTVKSFLNNHKINSWAKSHFTSFVEGFHSANLNLMGTQGLLSTEEVTEDDKNGSELFRWKNGYGEFLSEFVTSAGKSFLSHLRFDSVLKKIDWSQKQIKLQFHNQKTSRWIKVICRKLILTVPIGVLKAPARAVAGIEWLPYPPPSLTKSLEFVHMGHVEKLNFTFKNRFWEDLTEKQSAFFHTTPDHYFPTWWTQMPMRSPHLVAWQGGPKAEEMKSWKTEAKITAALKTLALLSRKTKTSLVKEIIDCETHNWSSDPFALGAYSYVGVDGSGIAKNLTKVLEGRIIIAGEGSVTGSGRGTVHGALASGLRAAKQALTLN